MLIEISNGDTYFFKVVTWDIRNFIHIDCVIIGIMGIFFFVSVVLFK